MHIRRAVGAGDEHACLRLVAGRRGGGQGAHYLLQLLQLGMLRERL